MPKDVEKFKELLEKIEDKKDEIYKNKVSCYQSFINENKWKELFKKLDLELETLKQELIEMYKNHDSHLHELFPRLLNPF